MIVGVKLLEMYWQVKFQKKFFLVKNPIFPLFVNIQHKLSSLLRFWIQVKLVGLLNKITHVVSNFLESIQNEMWLWIKVFLTDKWIHFFIKIEKKFMRTLYAVKGLKEIVGLVCTCFDRFQKLSGGLSSHAVLTSYFTHH